MKNLLVLLVLMVSSQSLLSQGYGIVRKNYISTVFDTISNISYEVLDSSTIRLGSIDTGTGSITNLGPVEYSLGINLTGATINPYLNHYLISSASTLLTFDMDNGDIVNSAQISGPFQTTAFQNYRFNTSDSIIYGLVPNNFYSVYYDSIAMIDIEVLDSSHIRFATIDPVTGEYALIGNVAYGNVYTLAGNAIDPHQMLYYYSAVDTLVGIDLYTGAVFSEIPIQLSQYAIFENFTYSCADTSIYGLTRQNYISSVYDSLLQLFIDVVDSTTFKLSKINPNTGAVTLISPYNLGIGATLNGSCFIDPNTMTYYFSSGNAIIGVSLATGLITSSLLKTFEDGAMFFDMMRSNENCLFATRIRLNSLTGLSAEVPVPQFNLELHPNPAQNIVSVKITKELSRVEVLDLSGKRLIFSEESSFTISSLSAGVYIVRGYAKDGKVYTTKLLKT